MSVVFGAGNVCTFNLYSDCPSDAWSRIGTTEVARASSLASRVRVAVSRYGAVADVKAEAAPKSVGDSVLSARVVGFNARVQVTAEDLGREVLRELNAGLEPSAWVPHVTGTRNAAVYAAAINPIGLPVAIVAGIASAASETARDWLSEQYRERLGFVIDESSIVRGEDRSAPAPSSIVGRVAGIAAGGPVTSTDPARDNRTPAQTASESIAWQPPAWLLVGGVVVGGLVALAALGYGARGVAQLVRETK